MAANGKSRMVSFRLPPKEYDRFREICIASGGKNVSELLRTAVTQFLQDGRQLDALDHRLEQRVAHLESQFQTLLAEIRTQKPANGRADLMIATQA
jgi:Arc/MetJ-type ribon-helix-helix transcriptional regulator